jgi:hypothetical protein
MFALDAMGVKPSSAKSRMTHVPAAPGAVKLSVAEVVPAPGGVLDPLKYFQSDDVTFAADVQYNPTQSRALPGPFAIVTEIVPPVLTTAEARVSEMTTVLTVTGSLDVSSEKPLLLNNRAAQFMPAVIGAVKVIEAGDAHADTGAVFVPFM